MTTSVKATKTTVPFKGTQITASDWEAAHDDSGHLKSTKTVFRFKDEGEIPRSLPAGMDINEFNTSNLLFPPEVEKQGAVEQSLANFATGASSEGGRSRANTFPTVLPSEEERHSSKSSRPALSRSPSNLSATAYNVAPLRTSQIEVGQTNSRTGIMVPPLTRGWWRDPNETRNLTHNEIIITQHHGTSINPLVEAISTMAHGDMPYNFQIIQTIDNLLLALQTERTLSGAKMSPKGQQISYSFEDVLVKTRVFILSKNHDEKLQQLFDHTKKSVKNAGSVIGGLNTPVMDEEHPVKEEDVTLDQAKILANQVISSSEFRSLVVELLKTLTDVLGKSFKPRSLLMKRELSGVVSSFEKGASVTELSKQVREAIKQPQQGQTVAVLQPTTVVDANGVQHPAQVVTNVTVPEQVWTVEQRDKLAKRLRTVLTRFGQNESFRLSASSLYKLLKNMTNRTTGELPAEQGGNIKTLHQHPESQKAWLDLQELIERFTGGYKLDAFVAHLEAFALNLKTDRTARAWIKEVKGYAHFLWANPTQVESERSVAESQSLIDRGRAIALSDTYKPIMDGIQREGRTILKAVKHDPERTDLADAFGQLSDDMFFSNGKPSLYVFQETAAQLRYLLVPLISKQLENIQVPQIEGYTPKYDFAARNLIFSGAEILPQNITLNVETGMNVALGETGQSYARSNFQVIISGVRMNVKNIDFYFYRKSFPKVSDEGRLAMDFAGDGISILMEWYADLTEGEDLKLVCSRVICGIDRVDINVDAHRHKIMGAVAIGIFKNKIKKSLEKVIAENLMQTGMRGATGINDLFSQRRNSRVSRQKQEEFKRDTRAQRRVEKDAQRRAKEMIRQESAIYNNSTNYAPSAVYTVPATNGTTVDPVQTSTVYNQAVQVPNVYNVAPSVVEGQPVPFSNPVLIRTLDPEPAVQSNGTAI